MTDNRTTELLPCPFCGGEAHIVNDYSSERDEMRWNLWHECNGHEGESNGYGYSLNPWFETPWYKTEAEAIAAWNTRAMHGTLTAEQVMAIAGKHQPDYCSDTHVCFDWQAIADELNARAERTCRIVEYADAPIPVCSECGAVQPDDYAVYYCWSCGAEVRDE